jgi:tRNA modification GTPase
VKLHFSSEDTIAAVATPPGEGGIGIVRLSGKKSLAIADQVFESKSKKKTFEQKNFTVRYGYVMARSGQSKKIVDEALLTVMRSPKSYTGEDVVEISTHGGQAVLQEVLRSVTEAGARPAEPGEFTKRAFLNGRLDLLQAEAVLDLIQAKTAQTLRWASSQLEGAFSKKTQTLKTMLLEIMSHLEAQVDFPEDFLYTDAMKEIERKLSVVQTNIQALLEGARFGLLAKRGLKVAIWGRPNVGKSSLFNQLAGTSRVIVTPHPGTTRDVVEEEIAIGGFPVRLQDTAGMQETENPIEKEGVERSRKSMKSADLVLFVLDRSQDLGFQDRNLYEECREKATILILNKNDLSPKIGQKDLLGLGVSSPVVSCSCLEEQGAEAVKQEIFRFISRGGVDIPDEMVVSTVRQQNLLVETANDLSRAQQACSKRLSSEFIASDVKHAMNQLGMLVGETTTDDVLELLFSKFCIGK